ncbi:hypothetical protein J2Y69_000915 [Microbacterium resistens]|uniref:Glycosyltransferase 2-like domain-containing protein n=1 Tax=Microbacterium resistens TaxID=156977 RepID=A0ABU1S9N4_9MICO|nr:glycosyltransferase family A protein [Microbacterium resistens]MDR6866323.1 hypothetical protein [Microbacterium resistens]
MTEYDVDVVIPVHAATRPIRRAASSILDHNTRSVQVTVVAHNIDPQIIRDNLGEYAEHPDLQLLHLADGIHSPAGPLNHGIAESTARYFAVLGSDDEFEPGAVDSWLALADDTDADAVLARVRRGIQGPDPMPPARRGRTRGLDGDHDRLSYRCVPQGLVSRTRFGHLRFTPGLASGEDQEFTAQLWFTGKHLAYDRTGPAYVLHEDGEDRVTSAIRSVEEDFRFLGVIAATDWFPALSAAQKRAWGVKNLRMHLMDAIAARLSAPEGFGAHAPDLVRVADEIERLSPGATALLARCDRDVLDEIHKPSPDPERIREAFGKRWGLNADSTLTRNPFLSLHRQAPFRTLRNMVA